MTLITVKPKPTEFDGTQAELEAKVDEVLSSLTLAKLKLILKFMARLLWRLNQRVKALEERQ